MFALFGSDLIPLCQFTRLRAHPSEQFLSLIPFVWRTGTPFFFGRFEPFPESLPALSGTKQSLFAHPNNGR